MARSDTTARTRAISRPGGLFDPARPSHRWWVAFTVSFSGFLVTMSQVAVQVALPQIMTVYGLNLDQAQWIMIAYVIAGAILVPTVGWLGNRLAAPIVYRSRRLLSCTDSYGAAGAAKFSSACRAVSEAAGLLK
jgi:MFS family permease